MAKIKTKFDSLVKLAKLKVDEKEREISKYNNAIELQVQDLEKLKEEYSNLEYPKEGNFSLITQFKIMQHNFYNQIKLKENEINMLKSHRDNLVNELKNLNLEYEKMKYLQGNEIKKYLNKLKEKEAKDLDEIALMLFKG